MTDKPDRPGGRGGLLKTGNTKGVGRKRSKVRAAMLQGLEEAIPVLIKIAMGKAEAERIVGADGQVEFEYPDFPDQLRAIDILGKYGLGTRQEVTGEGGSPIKVEDVGLFTPAERTRRLASLLDAARTRRAGSTAEDADPE